MPETCENCGRTIGNLETPHVHDGHIVCAACAKTLTANQPAPVSYASPVIVNSQQAATSVSGFGIASLVLGILTLLIAWIPLVGIFSIPVAAIGFILGLVGMIISLDARRSGVGMPIAGMVTCAISIVLVFVITGVFAVAASRPMAIMPPAASSAPRASNPSSPSIRPPTKVSEDAWKSASTTTQLDDLEVAFATAKIGKVPLINFGKEGQSKDELLIITLTLTNKSAEKKIEYRGWGGDPISIGEAAATLTDDRGNRYKRIHFGMSTPIKGQLSNESIYPGGAKTDVLVFEKPIDNAEALRLELPGAAIGSSEVGRIAIPTSYVDRS